MTDEILKEAKTAFELVQEREAENRRAALDDVRFARLAEQWPDTIRRQRERDGRPCLTINRLPAFIRQVVNDARQNKPSIKVHAADDKADVATAEVFNGLIRQIEASSRADQAYDAALECAVTSGFGWFRIGTRYACDDGFDLELTIDRIANPFSVWGDPHSTAADSSDWNSAFVAELTPRDQFEARWKGADPVDWEVYDGLSAPWLEEKSVLVCEYWKRERSQRKVLQLSDGQMVGADVFENARGLFEALGLQVTGERQVESHKVRQFLMTGAEVLEERDWAGRYIPIVPVYGEEVNLEGRRLLRSLVRDAKDPQMMFNFWRTASTELVALAPKAPFIGPVGAFKTDQGKWETANTDTHAYIEYDGAMPPQRQPYAGAPAGPLQEALNAADDMKAIIGIHDAGLGAPSNETSGRAILARQREGDVSTFHFIDNLSRAIAHAGRILIDLIPTVYAPGRMVRVLGADGTARTVTVGQAGQAPQGQPAQPPQPGVNPEVFDLAAGRYDLTVETGPSFTTRREEAANQMVELLRVYPAAAPIVGDLLAKNLDWPEADEIARRLQAMLPPQVKQAGQDPNAQAQAVQQQAAQQMAALKQQAGQQVTALQQEIGRLADALKLARHDNGLEARKLDIEQFEAETRRMQALAKGVAHTLDAQPAPGAGGF